VYYESKYFITNDLKKLPKHKVCLLLGTSRTLRKGKLNDYFFNRINACVELYQSGKVKFVLISGDNGSIGYNEPEDMKKELVARGIPERNIFLDYAGFDTYDSVVRANVVFGLQEFIVVSQKFHNQRAVYIARRFGIKAYGYNADDVRKMSGLKTKLREYFACTKAYFEVKLNVSPTFLGEPIVIK
jgi:SanA protein